MNVLSRDIPFNPAQADQFVQMEEPHLPDFLYHMDEDEDPVPCFAMTNPYEAILTHDPARTCVHVAPDMLHSFQPPTDLLHHLTKELTSGILKVQVRPIFIKLAIGPYCQIGLVIQFIHNPLE